MDFYNGNIIPMARNVQKIYNFYNYMKGTERRLNDVSRCFETKQLLEYHDMSVKSLHDIKSVLDFVKKKYDIVMDRYAKISSSSLRIEDDKKYDEIMRIMIEIDDKRIHAQYSCNMDAITAWMHINRHSLTYMYDIHPIAEYLLPSVSYIVLQYFAGTSVHP